MPFALLKSLFKRPARQFRRQAKRGSARLLFDILEERTLLHATVTAMISGPLTAPEGQAVTLVGDAHSTNPVDQGAGFDFFWSVLDHNGHQVASKTDFSFGTYQSDHFLFTPGDEGTYTVQLTAREQDGITNSPAQVAGLVISDVPPVVTVDHTAVTRPDHGTATNTGTWSDFDDAVTLSASQGTVVQHNDGTWNWSQADDGHDADVITITATNADGNTDSVTFTVNAEHDHDHNGDDDHDAVNDDPVISGTTLNQLVNDNGSINPFPNVTITDPYYPGGMVNVIVTINDPFILITGQTGTFSPASLAASGFLPLGNTQATFSGTAAQATAAIHQLTFAPTPNQVAPGQYVATDFIISVISQSGDHDGVSDCSTHITALSVNDAPTITGALANQTTTDAGTVKPFASVTVKDVDNPPQTLTVTVTLSNPANGSFSAASLMNSGFISLGGGVYTFTAVGPMLGGMFYKDSSGNATNALRQLVFVPTPGQVAVGHTVTTGFTISVSDGLVTTTDNNTTVVATAVNHAPTISGAMANQSVTDNSTIQPFANVTVTDVYSKSPVVTVTISLNNAANGVFNNGSLAAAKFYALGNGFYRFTGTPLNATFGLHLLTFVPTAHQVPPGMHVTTVFTLSVNDGAAFTSDGNTSVVATSQEAPPTISGVASILSLSDNNQKLLFTGASVADVFSPARTLNATISLDNPANGSFSMASLLASGFVQTGAHTGIYTYTGTAAQITTALHKLVFVPTAHQVPHGQQVFTNFTVSVSDGVGTANTSMTTIVTAV